jgi:hypothetical protein
LWRQNEDEDREAMQAGVRNAMMVQSGVTWAMMASKQARREEKAW